MDGPARCSSVTLECEEQVKPLTISELSEPGHVMEEKLHQKLLSAGLNMLIG
jgi:hypothetical protein